MGAQFKPQQPDLRSFIVYDELPDGCVAFEVPNNECLPHVHAGEFVVIDTSDREPVAGELYAITWKSDPEQKWEIAGMNSREGLFGHDGIYERRSMWFVGGVRARQLMSVVGTVDGPALRWVDGPYEDDYVREITHGKVVGIYEPDFRLQLAA